MKTFRNLVECVEYFKTEEICLQYLAGVRWGEHIACPHCGSVRYYTFKDGKRYKCAEKGCNLKFNAKTKTIFENTKIPLQKWFAALYLITSHKKGISSLQVARDIAVTQKTAWFMMHRLRAMFQYNKKQLQGVVEADETYVGGKASNMHQSKAAKEARGEQRGRPRANSNKFVVMGAVEREGKLILKQIQSADKTEPIEFLVTNVKRKSTIYTDEFRGYYTLPAHGYKHDTVTHGKYEYSRGDVSTNTIEGAFSMFKRSYIGIYHYMSKKHLQRYCNEIAFRYSTRKATETHRFNLSLSKCEGRLQYQELIANN